MQRGLVLALCLLWALPGGAMAEQAWRLTISGHQTFLFGDRGYGGGLRIPWEVVIEFHLADGEYQLGSGTARWIDHMTALSLPAGWFDCRQVHGTYLDSNLAMHETPRVRFSAFPVAGSLRDGRVVLQPGYESPGNYLAVTYECVSDSPVADNWFALAERGKQVLGKRQDAETRREGRRQWARVREVAPLPPEGRLELPLQDGWEFVLGDDDSASRVRYLLQRMPPALP